MKYVYIISCQRGQKLPEIYSMWSTYEKAIIAYSDVCESRYDLTFYQLFKFPLDELYCDISKWSDVKMGKSCKYRVKFDNHKELKAECLSVSRDSKINELGIID